MPSVVLAPVHCHLLKTPTLLKGDPIGAGTSSLTFVLLKTYTMPAASMGPNGQLVISHAWNCGPGTAAQKNIQIKFGGSLIADIPITNTSLSYRGIHWIANRNNQAIQIVAPNQATPNSFAQVAGALTGLTIDTSAAVAIEFYGHVGNAADVLTLEDYSIECLYGA